MFIVVGEVNSLARAGSVLHLLVYGLLNVSLIVFRETRAGGYDPDFEVPFYPAVPALGAVLSFALIGFIARRDVSVHPVVSSDVTFERLQASGYLVEHPSRAWGVTRRPPYFR